MIMRITGFALLLLVFYRVGAQDYNASKIPAELLKNANAVIRDSRTVLTISNAGSARYTQKWAITILNSKAEDFASTYESYDKFHHIKNVDATLYDAVGAKLKTLKKAEIKDVSGMGGGTDVSDDRAKIFGFYHSTYPFTVEFESDVELDGLMHLPRWFIVPDEKVSVQHTTFQVINNSGIPLGFKNFNLPKDAVVPAGDGKLLTWSITNLPAFLSEPLTRSAYDYFPMVYLRMQEFEIAGKHGSNQTWDKFGGFIYTLNEGRSELPEALKLKINSMVDAGAPVKEKVATLYDYLQKNTRYISIQLGIGGWQPFEASFVHEKKYGDCKALTNFMYSMLRHVGVPSIYALINAGARATPLVADMPGSQFNHVILCVPNGKDSIWLECTSQDLPPGYLGDFTADRFALLVLPSGSKLVRTPQYNAKQNSQVRRAHAELAENGTITAKVSTTYSGIQFDDVQYMMNHLTEEKKQEYYARRFDIGTYDIKNIEFDEDKTHRPVIGERFNLEAKKYAQHSGKRIMIVPNILQQSIYRLQPDTTRKNNVYFPYGYTYKDTVTITIGDGYKAEMLPKPQKINSPYGNYESDVTFENGQLKFVRTLVTQQGEFPAGDYNKVVTFYQSISKADKQRSVLVKTE